MRIVVGEVMTELLYEKVTGRLFSDDFGVCSLLNKKSCVVLTAYNDEEAIGDAVKEFLTQKNVVNVIVVDNNSKDSTSAEAIKAGARVVGEVNQGYGFACLRGLREALCCSNADVIILVEGDMTFRGRDIWKLLPFLDDADFVVGSRTHMHLTDSDSQMDWFYLWGNMFIAKLLQLRFFNLKFMGKTRFSDVGCTMRAINKKALARIIDDLKVGDNHFSPHMLKVAMQNGLRVIEVPITFRKRVGFSKGAGGNKRKGIEIGLKMLWEIIVK
jgi:glycosyltransferase involved in cell wall biosynthesis